MVAPAGSSSPGSAGSAAGDPYAHIAAFYDAEHDRVTGADVLGYARRGVPGPLLVLGCGTGRVCRGLEDHRNVVGLDASAAMLARARGRSRYVLGDMRGFDLGVFSEVIVPNGAFAFLKTRADQAACLESVHRALKPGGAVTIDLPMPDFSLLCTPHTEEKRAWQGEVDGAAARRTREVWRHPVAGRLHLVDRYYVADTLVATSHLELRLVFPRELAWLLESAGFDVDALWGDHVGGPVTEGCPRLLARAVRL
jgi:SAM-dependent methyltransferase